MKYWTILTHFFLLSRRNRFGLISCTRLTQQAKRHGKAPPFPEGPQEPIFYLPSRGGQGSFP
jgi:hypothetical protein